MAESVMNVRARPMPAKRKGLFRLWQIAVAVVIFMIVAMLGFDAYSGSLGIIPPRFEIVQTAAGRIIKVPAGGNLQAAIAKAESGDIVELQAGATYYGEIKLPNKPLTDFVTIQSSAISELPVDKRVGPANASSMAKIVTRGEGKSAVSAENGANHYRFVGIEFTASNADYIYNLVLFGNGEKVSSLPHDLEIDRSYLHPYKTGVVRRGVALNSASTTIKNSYIEGFGFAGEETQGICGWTGTRNVKIINNYIEGGAENIMFGGSDPASAELTPADIEVRGNHLNKPVGWPGKVTTKTLFELKNAKRVQLTGNLLTNNWSGSAFRITIRNQDGGANFSTIEDVAIRDNIINGAGEGVNILGKDSDYPSQTLRRLTIENNLFLDIGGRDGFEGSGYFIQINDGEDITVANNTVFNSGNTVTFYGAMPRNFVVRNNVMGHGTYGIHGHFDIKSAAAQKTFQNNVIVNNRRINENDSSFPPNNFWVPDYRSVGFINVAKNDFNLAASSRFKGIGCNMEQLPSTAYRNSK